MAFKEYLSPKKTGESRFQKKKSVFLGHLSPVNSEEEAKKFVQEMKKHYADARHNVWAYSLHDGTARCSDDGEPAGTGGAPVLDALNKKGITDAALVVTRYFGGILLGTGGLVHAYSTAALEALKDGGCVKVLPYRACRIVCGYDQYGKVARLLSKYGAKTVKTDFEERISCEFVIQPERYLPFFDELSQQSCGELLPEITGSVMIRAED